MNDVSKQIQATADKVERLATFPPNPDMSLITDAVAGPPMFPSECMGNAAAWINTTAKAANVYPDYVASAVLGAASGVIGKVYTVDVNQNDWKEPCSVWCFSLGDSGSGKTPACKAVRAALDAVEAKYRKAHQDEVDMDIRAVEAELVQLNKSQGKDLEDKLKRLHELRDMPPRATITDATKEAVAHVSNRSPRGLVLDDDELAGWLGAGMEGYGGGSARPMYLKAWNGGTARVDRRQAGGSIIIEKFLLAVHGGIQPDRLTSMLLKGQDDDGLAARALLFWPNKRKVASLRQPNANPATVTRALLRLGDLPMNTDGAHILTFAEDDTEPNNCAFSLFEGYWNKSENGLDNVRGMLKSSFAKMPAQVARLAGLLHLIDWAFGESKRPASTISAETMRAAIKLATEYFEPQARRVYEGLDTSPAERMAADILKIAKASDIRTVTKYEILRNMRPHGYRAERGADKPQQVRDSAMSILANAGWVVTEKQTTGGRPVEVYRFNPILFDNQLAA